MAWLRTFSQLFCEPREPASPGTPPRLGAFLTAQFEKNPAYLQDGDVVEATVATDDGAIDLGVQRNVVVYK